MVSKTCVERWRWRWEYGKIEILPSRRDGSFNLSSLEAMKMRKTREKKSVYVFL